MFQMNQVLWTYSRDLIWLRFGVFWKLRQTRKGGASKSGQKQSKCHHHRHRKLKGQIRGVNTAQQVFIGRYERTTLSLYNFYKPQSKPIIRKCSEWAMWENSVLSIGMWSAKNCIWWSSQGTPSAVMLMWQNSVKWEILSNRLDMFTSLAMKSNLTLILIFGAFSLGTNLAVPAIQSRYTPQTNKW